MLKSLKKENFIFGQGHVQVDKYKSYFQLSTSRKLLLKLFGIYKYYYEYMNNACSIFKMYENKFYTRAFNVSFL